MFFKNNFSIAALSEFLAIGFILMTLVGCSGGGGGGGGGAGSVPVGPGEPSVLFVADGGSTVSLFLINTNSGDLDFAGYLQAQVSDVRATAVHPNGSFVYVLGQNRIAAFHYEPVQRSWSLIDRYSTGSNPGKILISKGGLSLYTNNRNDDSITAFAIDPTTGRLTEMATVATGDSPKDLVLHPSGDFLYSVNNDDQEVSRFPVLADGSLGAEWVVYSDSFNLAGLVFIKNGERALLTISSSSDNIIEIVVDSTTGDLTAVGAQTAGRFPTQIIVNSDESLAFVVNTGSSTVTRFRIDEFGDIGFPSSYEASAGPVSVAFGPQESTLYVGSSGEHQVNAFRIETGGVLNPANSVRPLGAPNGLAMRAGSVNIEPSTRNIYLPHSAEGRIYIYDRDVTSGEPIESGSVIAGAGVRHVAFHPKLDIAYAISSTAAELEIFVVDPGTGALSFWQTMILQTDGLDNWIRLAIDPTGRFLYALDGRNPLGNLGRIQAFSIDSTGLLTSTFMEGLSVNPENLTISPNGRYLLCLNSYADGIYSYRIDEVTGQLSLVHSFGEIDRPLQARFHPSGNWVYITAQNEEGVYRLRMQNSGIFNNFQFYQKPISSQTIGVAVHPDGSSLYMTSSDGSLSHFSIDANGALSYESEVFAGQSLWVEISEDGKHAYSAASAELRWFELSDGLGSPEALGSLELSGFSGYQKSLTIN